MNSINQVATYLQKVASANNAYASNFFSNAYNKSSEAIQRISKAFFDVVADLYNRCCDYFSPKKDENSFTARSISNLSLNESEQLSQDDVSKTHQLVCGSNDSDEDALSIASEQVEAENNTETVGLSLEEEKSLPVDDLEKNNASDSPSTAFEATSNAIEEVKEDLEPQQDHCLCITTNQIRNKNLTDRLKMYENSKFTQIELSGKKIGINRIKALKTHLESFPKSFPNLRELHLKNTRPIDLNEAKALLPNINFVVVSD